mmetsp:Transcript_68793/g.143449  ORF Transcript_68793/g.143449 Transcript_68793/m.143449 type:complete len:102 (+) Transcript_68793:144-449(+)
MVHGRQPELHIFGDNGRVVERINLLKINNLKESVQGVRDMLEAKGFVKKPKTRKGRRDDTDAISFPKLDKCSRSWACGSDVPSLIRGPLSSWFSLLVHRSS